MADANCTVWYAPYAERGEFGGGTDTNQIVAYDQLGIVNLTANVPLTLSFPISTWKGNTGLGGADRGVGANWELRAMGWALRVPDSGANLFVFSGGQTVTFNLDLQNNW